MIDNFFKICDRFLKFFFLLLMLHKMCEKFDLNTLKFSLKFICQIEKKTSRVSFSNKKFKKID